MKLIIFMIIILLFQYCLISNIIEIPLDYPNIQQGIDAAIDGDTVQVSHGVYTGVGNRDLSFNGKKILLQSKSGPNSTIIDCQADSTDPHRGVNFTHGEDSFSIIDGFTIKNGNAYGMDGNRGAGIYINNCSPKIINCILSNNTASMGGAIYSIYYGDPIIRDCWIHHNSSIHNGAGITLDGWTGGICDAEISGNIFEYNTTGHSGAAIYANQGRVRITDNVIRYNTVSSPTYWGGGGICLWIGHYGSQQVIKNNVIYGNQAPTGGGLYIRYDGSSICNNTIFDNLSYLSGGGIYVLNQAIRIPVITDCILWSNYSSTSQGHQIFLENATGSSANVNYCCIEDGWSGVGNISQNPMFISGPAGDFYLSQTQSGQPDQSPCVDSGSNTASVLGIDHLTTRTDQIHDDGIVDIGFHYEVDSNPGYVEEINLNTGNTSFEVPTTIIDNIINIRFYLETSSNVDISLYDLSGRNIYTLLIDNLSSGDHELVLPVNINNSFTGNIYFLKMNLQSTTYTRKIIIIH